MAANGVGALIGALLTASLSKLPRKGLVLLGCVFAFAGSRYVSVSLVLLAVVGCGVTLYMGTTNTILLTHVTDEVRGWIM